jgi:hypothetical protein
MAEADPRDELGGTSLSAGPELDAEVARRVLEWTDTDLAMGELAAYSQSIEAAWIVVEHMKHAKFSHRLRFIDEIKKTMRVEDGTVVHPSWWIFFLTPERICDAALRASDQAVDD